MPKAKPVMDHPSISAVKHENARLRKENAELLETNDNLRRAMIGLLEKMTTAAEETRAIIFPNWNGNHDTTQD